MEIKSTQIRNLVVLGRTGVGKSTVVNHLVGKTVFPVTTSLEGVTRERRTSEEETEKLDIKDDEEKVEYNIKIIDTVGLHDKDVKSEERIQEMKDYSIFQRPYSKGVNLIFFVIRKGIFIEEEKKVFDSIISKFNESTKDVCGLIVTGCEGLSDEGRDEEINEIKNGQNTKTLAVFMGKGIYPVGFPNVENLKPFLKEEYERRMKTDAEKLRKVVLDSTQILQKNELFKSQSFEFKGISKAAKLLIICITISVVAIPVILWLLVPTRLKQIIMSVKVYAQSCFESLFSWSKKSFFVVYSYLTDKDAYICKFMSSMRRVLPGYRETQEI